MNSYQMIKSANIQLNTQMNTIKSYANDNVKINMNAKSFIPRSKRQNHVMINQDNKTSNNQNSNNEVQNNNIETNNKMIKDNSVFVVNGKEIEKNNIKSFIHSNKPKQLYKCKYLQKDMEKWYSNRIRVKDIIHEKFEKYLFENQNNKLNIEIIPIDKKKVIFKQSFNKLTKNNSELLVKEVYTQIRKEDFKIMIELSNTINETKYSKCFVTFFIHLRNKLLNETSKESFGKEMTSYLLKIVKEKFENPPKEISKKEGESIEDEQKRK